MGIGVQEFIAFWRQLDFAPLWISLKTGIVATAVSFFLGIFAACKIARAPAKLRVVLDALFTLPMVLPPTAVGFFLLLLFSRRRLIGAVLYERFGILAVQTWLGCVLAATVISFPLMYKNAKAAFEQIDKNIVYAARTLGIPEWKIFFKIIFPSAKPGILSGTVLTFARALGEYGATSMLAGNIAGRTGTVSQNIAVALQGGDYAEAGFWACVVLIFALLCIIGINIFGEMSHRFRNKQ